MGQTTFEIHDGEDGNLHLVKVERNADGEATTWTMFAAFADMKAMDSLGPRLAKLCLETAQAALAGRA